MNVIFLFLTRQDLKAIPHIPNWLNDQGKIEAMVAFVNPHLAIDPSEEQVGLENQILAAMRSTLIQPEDRINLEMILDKRWRQIPRDVMLEQFNVIFKPFGITTEKGLVVLSESFQSDRLSELLTKLRPAWPAQIGSGNFVLVFGNQIPEKQVGRPVGKIQDPEKLRIAQERMAKARAARKNKKAPEPAAA